MKVAPYCWIPKTIRIIDDIEGSGSLDDELISSGGKVLSYYPSDEENDDGESTISVGQLEGFEGDSNIVIEADDGIIVGPIEDGALNLSLRKGVLLSEQMLMKIGMGILL